MTGRAGLNPHISSATSKQDDAWRGRDWVCLWLFLVSFVLLAGTLIGRVWWAPHLHPGPFPGVHVLWLSVGWTEASLLVCS